MGNALGYSLYLGELNKTLFKNCEEADIDKNKENTNFPKNSLKKEKDSDNPNKKIHDVFKLN